MGETVYAQFSDCVIEKRRPATRTGEAPLEVDVGNGCAGALAPDLMTIQFESETAVQACGNDAARRWSLTRRPAKLSDESPSCIAQSAADCVTLACDRSLDHSTSRRRIRVRGSR